jgi:nitrile hydratase beta subunit
MKGPQDLGGMMGFGPINPEENEPVFHAAWERRVLGFTVLIGAAGAWTVDQTRHQREKLPPSFYWSRSYYEIWLQALTLLLRDRGMVTGRDLAAQRMVAPPHPVKRVLQTNDVAPLMAKGFAYNRTIATTASFAVGDIIKTRRMATTGHTRLPAYAWGKSGVIDAVRGSHVYPDSNGMGRGEAPQWLYTVRFTAQEIWGRNSNDTILLDLFEPYLEPA